MSGDVANRPYIFMRIQLGDTMCPVLCWRGVRSRATVRVDDDDKVEGRVVIETVIQRISILKQEKFLTPCVGTTRDMGNSRCEQWAPDCVVSGVDVERQHNTCRLCCMVMFRKDHSTRNGNYDDEDDRGKDQQHQKTPGLPPGALRRLLQIHSRQNVTLRCLKKKNITIEEYNSRGSSRGDGRRWVEGEGNTDDLQRPG